MAGRDVLLKAANAAARLTEEHRSRCPGCMHNDARRGADPAYPYEDCPEFYRLRWQAQLDRWAYENAR